MPPVEFTTKGFWLEIPAETKERIQADEARDLYGSMHAACHAVKLVVPLHVLCDPSDIDCEHIAEFVERDRYGGKRVELGWN